MSSPKLVANFKLDEGSGTRIHDVSENHLVGGIVGGSHWVQEGGRNYLKFTGTNSIVVPSSRLLNIRRNVTIEAWIKGTGSDFHLRELPITGRSVRGPYFQVAGNHLYFVTNSDGHHSHIVWTGSADASLRQVDVRRQTQPVSGVEPKMQVVDDKRYYEYFGQDGRGVWQIFTATSDLNGADWQDTPRTSEVSGEVQGRVEQDLSIQFADGHIYYAFPEKDARDNNQLHAAFSKADGSAYVDHQHLTVGSWLPRVVISGGRAYYAFNVHDWIDHTQSSVWRLAFAVSNLDETSWRIVRTLPGDPQTFPNFTVRDGTIYFVASRAIHDTRYVCIGSMRSDGTSFSETLHALPEGTKAFWNLGIQIIGWRLHYSYMVADQRSEARRTSWLAESNLDGTGWRTEPIPFEKSGLRLGYQSFQIVGGKTYFGADVPRGPGLGTSSYLGFSGSNIVNKGDAYGVGLTDNHEARAFINAGADYLSRGEAPDDPGGGTASYAIDERFHHLVARYDGNSVTLLVDGVKRSVTRYKAPISRNTFPLVIGDGFHGVIRDIAIYDGALSDDEIGAQPGKQSE